MSLRQTFWITLKWAVRLWCRHLWLYADLRSLYLPLFALLCFGWQVWCSLWTHTDARGRSSRSSGVVERVAHSPSSACIWHTHTHTIRLDSAECYWAYESSIEWAAEASQIFRFHLTKLRGSVSGQPVLKRNESHFLTFISYHNHINLLYPFFYIQQKWIGIYTI